MWRSKLKTNKSVRKRFKITANGKVKKRKSARRHLLTDKTGARKRKLRKQNLMAKGDAAKIKSLLPYG